MGNEQHIGFIIDGIHHISGRDFLNLPKEKTLLIDVRPDYELGRLFDVENIFYCPYQEVQNRISDIPIDLDLVVADAVGLRSKEIAKMLKDVVFNKIYHLAGGIVAWEREGNPVTTDKTKILTGSCMCQLKVRNKKQHGKG